LNAIAVLPRLLLKLNGIEQDESIHLVEQVEVPQPGQVGWLANGNLQCALAFSDRAFARATCTIALATRAAPRPSTSWRPTLLIRCRREWSLASSSTSKPILAGSKSLGRTITAPARSSSQTSSKSSG